MKKVYCAKCYYYYYCRVWSDHKCNHPRWLINKKAVGYGSAINPPRTYRQWYSTHNKPEELNRNNNCKLYERKRWYHWF